MTAVTQSRRLGGDGLVVQRLGGDVDLTGPVHGACKHPNVVCVALASRNARVAWAMLSRGQDYQHRRRDALELPALPAALA